MQVRISSDRLTSKDTKASLKRPICSSSVKKMALLSFLPISLTLFFLAEWPTSGKFGFAAKQTPSQPARGRRFYLMMMECSGTTDPLVRIAAAVMPLPMMRWIVDLVILPPMTAQHVLPVISWLIILRPEKFEILEDQRPEQLPCGREDFCAYQL